MKTLFCLLCLITFGFIIPISAQQKLRIQYSCHWDDDETTQEVTTFEPSQEAEQIIQRITLAMGLVPKFIIKSANIKNALATTEGGQRYILYNTTFIEKFKREAQTQWAVYCVFAHEIAHHLNNDDFKIENTERRINMELNADIFAGSILQKMGATLAEAQAGINTFPLNDETNKHPKNSVRIEAIASGWIRAKEGIQIKMDAYVETKASEIDNEKLAKEWFDKGKELGFSKETIQYLNKAIQINPKFLEAYYYRAKAGMEMGSIVYIKYKYSNITHFKNPLNDYKIAYKHYSQAISDLTQVIKLNSNYAEAYNLRAITKSQLCYVLRSMISFSRHNSYDIDKFFFRYPNIKTPIIEFPISDSIDVRDRYYNEAINDFSKAINIEPYNANFYNNRGKAKSDDYNYDDAKIDFDNAIRLDNKLAEAYFNKANIFEIWGDGCLQSIEYYDKAIFLKPNYVEAYYERGNAKSRIERHEEAIKDYNRAIELNPSFIYAYYSRGDSKNSIGKYNEAIKDFDTISRLDNFENIFDDIYAYKGRCYAYYRMGELNKAIEQCNNILRIEPDIYYYYELRARFYLLLKEYDKALNDCDYALRINPNTTPVYVLKGDIKIDSGKYSEAIEDFNEAIEVYKNNGHGEHFEAYAKKGCAIIKLNDNSRMGEAIDLINKALRIKNDNAYFAKESDLDFAKDCKNEALKKLKD